MLLQCPDCGGKVSSKAAACPSCGCPVDSARKKCDKGSPAIVSSRASVQESDVGSDTEIRLIASSEAKPREKTPSPKVATLYDDSPLLKCPGILITHSLIDLHGRSYSIPQLNSIKVDAVPHPQQLGLSLAFLASGGIGMILLLYAVKEDGVGWFIWSFMLFGVAIYTKFASSRLPQWALLRFEMSSGEVKALNSERMEVEQVADAIRRAMAAR